MVNICIQKTIKGISLLFLLTSLKDIILKIIIMCLCVLVAQSCLTLCNLMDCSP